MLYKWNKKTPWIYPSAPLEESQSAQRLEEKLNELKSFNNSINNIKERITYLKDKNYKSKKNFKKHEMITTILQPFDTIVFVATTSSSIILAPAGIGLIATPKSASTACG